MNYFNLFSNILVTKGVQRILIIDLQREKAKLYPLELSDIIEELKKKSIKNLFESYDRGSHEFLREYLKILLDNEYGFITKDYWDNNFPPFSYKFSTPNEITNAYLEIDDLHVLSQLNKSLSNLGAEHIVIHYDNFLSFECIQFIENTFKNTTITSIEIFSKYHEIFNEDFFEVIDNFCSRIYSLAFYSCNKNPFKPKDKYKFTVAFVKEQIKLNSCGKVDLKYFNVNLPKVLEAINHNSCLHKKISIDKYGNIKNCPSMYQSFGNIKNITLEEALNVKDFKNHWNLTKDKIEICKECEFRYVCTDCRAYTEETNTNNEGLDISKPIKCGYNPYKAEWEEWSTNPLKEKIISKYGL
ncbi:grasp-with-spasm system SPASM domain peptide maturase [Chryseobacterium sp. Leaf405]|uniref:grasp-with-spasm system SPASM domain peptide maturase n=1 Tax=Chryseobacterium sp. Leaf405 TaxID=1736367 RepID=UPI0006FA2258|nr:grasp-with-spasm system SPASM domain peptide maturase [Chryseobacterium sp. Leaf405]KQT25906.1 grasp-with-spasm system SPASM domain peptide maturase [Chryseobacterium sp. Leaf405]